MKIIRIRLLKNVFEAAYVAQIHSLVASILNYSVLGVMMLESYSKYEMGYFYKFYFMCITFRR